MTIDEGIEGQRPARYGPFHRIYSPTQSEETARQQIASGEVWGRVPFGGSWAQVKAYRGPLPDGLAGIEFYTDVPPDPGDHPVEVRWSGDSRRPDVQTADGYARIPCVVVRKIPDE